MTIAVGSMVMSALIASLVPLAFKHIVNAATQVANGAPSNIFLYPVLLYIAIVLTANLFERVAAYSESFWSMGTRQHAVNTIMQYITHHSRAYYADRFAGSITTKGTHAANGTREMTKYILWDFGELSVSALMSIVLAFTVHPLIGALFSVWLFVTFIINLYFSRKRVPYARAVQALGTKLTGAIADLVGNISLMQEFTRRAYELGRIAEINSARSAAGLRSWHFGQHLMLFNVAFQTSISIVMVLIAASLTSQHQITAGDIVLVLTMIFRLQDRLQMLGSHLFHFSETWGEIEESLEELFIAHEFVDTESAKHIPLSQPSIVFNKVTFTYESGHPVLKNFNLKIEAFQKVGLVGKSGAGKSTMMKILLRHYEINSGEVLIGGHMLNEFTRDSIREHLAIVPQEASLFHRTLSENIAYGAPHSSAAQIQKAAEQAHAHLFIQRLPLKYDTLVGERGVKLSGGERQRIAIARAILKDAPILLLDEATASLDSESEAEIQRALHSLMKGKTVMAIAHRLSTLREMDRIIVLDKGEIAEDGTHAELIAKGGVYAELWKHQAGGFLQE